MPSHRIGWWGRLTGSTRVTAGAVAVLVVSAVVAVALATGGEDPSPTDAAVTANRGRWKPVPHPTSSTARPSHDATDRRAASIAPSGSTARFSTS